MKLSIQIAALAAIAASSAYGASSQSLEFACFDTRGAYVKDDLSQKFRDDHMSAQDMREYRRQGYSYFFAGRNCGLNNQHQPRYEVLFMASTMKLSEPIKNLAFSLYSAYAGIELQGDLSPLARSEDIVVFGSDRERLSNLGGTIVAKVDVPRGSGKFAMIIRKIANPTW